VITWRHGGGVYVLRYDGQSWNEVGRRGPARGSGISDSTAGALYPSLAMSALGEPVLVWMDGLYPDWGVFAKRFNGTSWTEIGTGSARGTGLAALQGSVSYPSGATEGPESVTVVWSEDRASDPSRVYVRRYDGWTWGPVGPDAAISGTEEARTPGVTLDSAGRPLVVWQACTPSYACDVYVKRFDGVSWVAQGSGAASGGGISATGKASEPQLAMGPDNRPVVAWADESPGVSEVYVRQYDGAAWVELGLESASGAGVSRTGRPSSGVQLAVPADGLPIVAWVENRGSSPGHVDEESDLYVRRFNGTYWESVGTGSASTGGVSQSGHVHSPTLALDSQGRPVVAWVDGADARAAQVHVRRFNGTSWVEVGDGSATGAGVSNSCATATKPTLRVGGGQICVAWTEAGEHAQQVVMRCADE